MDAWEKDSFRAAEKSSRQGKSFICKPGGDLPGAVGRTGIHNDDLVHQLSGALQTAFQHVHLIFTIIHRLTLTIAWPPFNT